MSRYIITESQLKKIVDSQLDEALGVPDGIYEAAVELYDEIVNNFNRFQSPDDGRTFKAFLATKKTIGDDKTSGVEFTIHIKHHKDYPNTYDIISMHSVGTTKLVNHTLHNVSTNAIELGMVLLCPEHFNLAEIKKFIISKKNYITESLAHELKHYYVNTKHKKEGVFARAKYDSYRSTRTRIPTIDNFIYCMYFADRIENYVRTSEVYSNLRINNATKKDFVEKLENSDVVKQLKKLRDFSYKDLISRLYNDIEDIDNFLKRYYVNFPHMMPTTDDEKVKRILEVTRDILSDNTENEYNQRMYNPIQAALDRLLGVTNKHADYVKKRIKNKNIGDFIQDTIKRFNFVGGKMLKKIAKLYAMLPDKNETNESIKNWDLHHAVNETDKKMVYKPDKDEKKKDDKSKQIKPKPSK